MASSVGARRNDTGEIAFSDSGGDGMDFGDCWHQDIQVEVVRDVTISMKQAVCIDGARRCPPEDCGGTTGFENFLLAISDPTHLDYAALVEWNGGPFDPEQFNLGEANVQIQLNR
jgi:hypothetical protein